MQPSRRPQRLALQIQQEISLLLTRGLKDRRIGLVTVTGVRLSSDLKYARVFISAMGSETEKQESLQALRHAAGWVRHELGSRIRTRFLPEIDFVIDTSQEYGDRIDMLLDEIHRHDASYQSAPEPETVASDNAPAHEPEPALAPSHSPAAVPTSVPTKPTQPAKEDE